jgi:peroxiredoxin Q/BCP
MNLENTPPELNQAVPQFSAPSTQGEFSLAAHQGKTVVLYFYPKDNTPGCTTESEDFKTLYPAFQEANAVVYGISRDSLKSHENFQCKLALPFPLISDPDETLCNIFGVMKQKNMYGKQVRGIERSTFIINKKGILVQMWRGVKVPSHAQAVLDFVRTLGN